MYEVTCSQCKQPINVATEGYLALPLVTEAWPNNQRIYLHVGECATKWEAEQRKAQSDNSDDPQLKLL